MSRLVWVLLATTGCWKLDRSALEGDRIPFTPAALDVSGWVVEDRAIDLDCPDGEPARVYFVYPADPTGPLPTAVLYHSGSFDFVLDPDPTAPLAGPHLSDPSRLEGAWAARMAFATLGMYPAPLPGELHRGSLPGTLADRGVAVVMPINCWGDWWHNGTGADNDFEGDFFFRTGRTAATWAYRSVAEPDFAETISLDLPFEPDPNALYAIGLGEGGRAVGEILHLDTNEDGQPDHLPRAIAIDSLIDDLATLPIAQPATTVGLARIFPNGEFDSGALGTAPTLPPTAFVYSPVDAVVPADANTDLLERLEDDPVHAVFPGTAARHVLLNDDLDLASDVVDFLLAQ